MTFSVLSIENFEKIQKNPCRQVFYLQIPNGDRWKGISIDSSLSLTVLSGSLVEL